MGECTSACTSDTQNDIPIQSSMKIQYDGHQFIVPSEISFEKQSTFVKIEQAARNFCSYNNIPVSYSPVISRIIAYRHEKVFQIIWDKLTSQEKDTFLDDLMSIEHDLMDSFYYHFIRKGQNNRRLANSHLLDSGVRSSKNQNKNNKTAIPRLTINANISQQQTNELAQIGHYLLQNNRVAAVLMCAGSSSRFKGQDKFLIPFKFDKITLLDIVFQRLKKNVGSNKKMPIIINCNQSNIQIIQDYIKKNLHYGFDPQKIRYVLTSALAVFDQRGNYCLTPKLRLIRRPSGTASCAEELLNSSAYSFLKEEGVQYIYFSGMQNLLQNPCDPVFIGMMKSQKRRVGVKCVNPLFYCEKLPRFCGFGDRVQLLCEQKLKDMSNEQLATLPVAMNSLLFELESLKGIIRDYNNSLFLAGQYHVIRKNERIYDVMRDRVTEEQCFSFERDIRDIVSCIKNALLYKVSRSKQFAPVCSHQNEYSFLQAEKVLGGVLENEIGKLIKKDV